MDWVHVFLSIVLPPMTLITLLLYMPIYLALKFLSYVRRSVFIEDVAGKVVLITGAASGIGERMAYEYAKRGANLVLVDLKEDRLGLVVDKARSLGSPDAIAVAADVSVIEDCRRSVDAAVDHFGKLDHLVNNAGIARSGLFEKMNNLSDFSPIMDVNFWGPVYCTHFAIPHLRKSKGKTIVVASTCGWCHVPTLAFYNASKAAAIALYETLRTEVGLDIGITILNPGLIKSEMPSGSILPESLPFFPFESVEECGKAFVRSACRGDRYSVEPFWARAMYPFLLLCPEFVDCWSTWFFLRR